MGETSKVRLVHCPKCANLLPEHSDYSVYQCGGCGAVLRAKKKGNLEGGKGLERFYEENFGVVSEKSENLSGKSEDLVGKGRVSGAENMDGRVSDTEGSVSDTTVERFGNDSKKDVSKRDFEIENFNLGESEDVNKNYLRSKVNNLENPVDNAYGLRKSSLVFERNLGDIREEERFGTRQGYFEEMRCSSSNYVGEGQPKHCLDSSYKREVARDARVDDVEPDREELLRKLEELKDQLRRVQNGNNNFHEKFPTEHRMAPLETYVESDYFRGHPSVFHRVSREFFAPNKHVAGESPYFEQYHEPFAPHHRSDIASHGYHNSIHGSSYVPRYEDPFEAQIFRRPPQRIHGHHQYTSPELDHFESHPYDTSLGHLSCSCYSCYDGQQKVPPQVRPSTFANRKFPHVPNKPDPYHHEVRGSFGSHGYNSRLINTPPLGSTKPQSHTRWPSDLSLERNTRARPQRAVLRKGHRYRPVASGAPFVTCRNCFELLKLPKKVCIKMGEWQMSCAACSSVISFAIVDEKLTSVDPSAKQTNTEIMDSVNGIARESLKRDNVSYCSEDYANSGYDFQAMDRDTSFSSTCHSLSSRKSAEMHNIHSVSYNTSEGEHVSDDLATREEVSFSPEPPEKSDDSSPPPGSPPQDSFEYTSKYRAVNQCEMRNFCSRSDQERVMTNVNTLRKSSLKETLETEMELSPNDYGNTRLTKNASEKCREDDELNGKKGDSFFAGFLKKSFRSNQTVESAKKNVMVNGHLIPDKLVKKAEKLAGPVYPGQYWYDYRAGFWGVVGGPCLGIVPPFIEEFNYPMPEKCAAGTTSVFVNGRELHQKDLKLLSTRGLPSSTDKSYIVDITGRVVYEDTGEELVSLGKLAPTIEKVKHGFGMRPPKAVA